MLKRLYAEAMYCETESAGQRHQRRVWDLISLRQNIDACGRQTGTSPWAEEMGMHYSDVNYVKYASTLSVQRGERTMAQAGASPCNARRR